MVKARSLLVFSTVSFGLVTLQGGSDGCFGPPPVSSCTHDRVMVSLLPGDCAPIPACDRSGYFAGPDWVLDAPTLPSHLTISLQPLPAGGQNVATVCAKASAPRGLDYSGTITGTLNNLNAETELAVHIRGESSMQVRLAVEGAPVPINGRTLISAAKDTSLLASALVGSFSARKGQWSLVTANADFVEMSANLGKGSLMTPAAPQLADLGLQLYKSGSETEPSDDVFSLPVRIMKDGGAAVTVRQLESSYRGIPCPGMSLFPTCEAKILCFSAADSVLNWPPRSSTVGREFDVVGKPAHADNAAVADGEAGELFAACEGAVTSVTYSIRNGAETLDTFELQVE